jgi:GT2 family glycosyltransferase
VEHRRLAVVIVNYRTPELSIGALDSVLPQIDPDLDEVLIVDNGSADGSVEALEADLRLRRVPPSIRVVAAPENRGFSAGVNHGLAASDARYYLVLNSDVLVREGAVDALLACARSQPRAALIGPRLEDLDGTPQISTFPYPSPFGELVEAAGTGPITRLFTRARNASIDSLQDVHLWRSFAAILLSREVIDDIGAMDEAFFMFFEDVDYCRRAQAAGWQLIHCPEARIAHLRGASSPVKRLRSERKRLPAYFYDSRSRYLTKHHGRGQLVLINSLWLLGQAIAWLRELAGRPRHNARGAALDIWRGTLRPLRSSRS